MVTKENAAEYIGGLIGKKAVDIDGAYGVQCVDLIKKYLKDCCDLPVCALGDGMYVAKNITLRFPDKFKLIPYTSDIKLQAGDIVSYHSASSPACGHAAIVYKDLNGGSYGIIEQWNGCGTIRANIKTVAPPQKGKSYTIINIARPILDTEIINENPFVTEFAYKLGDEVRFSGGGIYISASADKPAHTREKSNCKITRIFNGKRPYHLESTDGGGVYGWVDEANIATLNVPSTPAKKSIDEIAREVMNGKWGNNPQRKEKLTAAGYDYAAVQKRVNELL